MRPHMRGMTLIELLVVMGILAVLIGLAVPGVRMLTKGRVVKAAAAQVRFDLQRAIGKARQGFWVSITFDPAGRQYVARAVDYDGGVTVLFRSSLPAGARFGPGHAGGTCAYGASPPSDGIRFFSDRNNDNILIIGPQGGPITTSGAPVPVPGEVMITDGDKTRSLVITQAGSIVGCSWNGTYWVLRN